MTSVGRQLVETMRAERAALEPARCTCGHYQAVHRDLTQPETDRTGACTAGGWGQPCICDGYHDRNDRGATASSTAGRSSPRASLALSTSDERARGAEAP